MAGSSGASEASFDVSFETDMAKNDSRDVELVEELIQANRLRKFLTSPTSKTSTLTAAPTITM